MNQAQPGGQFPSMVAHNFIIIYISHAANNTDISCSQPRKYSFDASPKESIWRQRDEDRLSHLGKRRLKEDQKEAADALQSVF